MLTARNKLTEEVIDITKFETPRLQIEKETLICKFCGGKLGIKHGLRRIKHFFHISTCTSSLHRHPESVEHNLGKELIAEHIKTSWKEYSEVEVEFEYPIQEIGRIADIAMKFPNGWIVVHEIQLSSITNEELQKRTEAYNSVGADIFWWLGKSADSKGNREWCISNFGYSLSIEDTVLQARIEDLRAGKPE